MRFNCAYFGIFKFHIFISNLNGALFDVSSHDFNRKIATVSCFQTFCCSASVISTHIYTRYVYDIVLTKIVTKIK